MLKKLSEIFSGAATAHNDAAYQEEKLQVSLAALLVEIARADFDQTDSEHAEITKLLADHFGLSEAESLELLAKAEVATDDAVCLHDFTRTLHTSLEPAERLKVVELLWMVALSDNKLDKYEDYLVKKVADLMHVPTGDVIRIRNQVQD